MDAWCQECCHDDDIKVQQCAGYSTILHILAVLAHSSFKDMKNFNIQSLMMMTIVMVLEASCNSPQDKQLALINESANMMKLNTTVRKLEKYVLCLFVCLFYNILTLLSLSYQRSWKKWFRSHQWTRQHVWYVEKFLEIFFIIVYNGVSHLSDVAFLIFILCMED